MKSAEKWLTDEQDGHSITGRVMRLEDVRAIQADALRHAAELCFGNEAVSSECEGGGLITETSLKIMKRIQAEADRIEKGSQTK